ncbi:MAG: efflux RND transporter periplasmic adaptor subunit [Helicobacteraceae bacterium]|jgi:HlyD family secretion protein|nr:efflux RND transporter periplasmic adaptor subunit [Helicobacteraceae bacterium]
MSQVQLEHLHRAGGRKKLIVAVVFALIAAAIYAIWFFFIANATEEAQYITTPVERRDLKVTVQATGNLEPLRTVTVGIEVSGTLKEVLADYNDEVKVGQVLARLDTVKLESALSSSRAQLKVAEANVISNEVALNEAALQLNRLKQIHESTNGDYPSQKDMDTAQAVFDRASAALIASKAQLEQAKAETATGEENLKKAVVVSPINGIVLSRAVDAGQTVAASMQTPTLFTIAEDLKKMQVVVAVDEADVGDVKEGQMVTFSVNAYPNREFNGSVTQVRLGSQITSGVVTYNTVVLVDNRDGLLRPGMTAQASIVTKFVQNTPVVPNAAFRFTPPPKQDAQRMIMRAPNEPRMLGDRIYVLENNEPKMIRVKRGETDGAFSAVISDEIKEGAQVITSTRQKPQ